MADAPPEEHPDQTTASEYFAESDWISDAVTAVVVVLFAGIWFV